MMPTSVQSTAYDALVTELADAVPWGRDRKHFTIELAQVHTVLAAHPDIAQFALNNEHLAAALTDELNSCYDEDSLLARLGVKVVQAMCAAATDRLHDDFSSAVQEKQDAEELMTEEAV